MRRCTTVNRPPGPGVLIIKVWNRQWWNGNNTGSQWNLGVWSYLFIFVWRTCYSLHPFPIIAGSYHVQSCQDMPRYPPLKIVVHEAVHLQGRLNDSQRAIATSDSSHSCKDNAWCCHTLQYTQRVQRVFGSSRHLQIASQTCHGHQIHRKQISVGKRGGQHLKTRKRQNDGQITVPNEPKIVFFFQGSLKLGVRDQQTYGHGGENWLRRWPDMAWSWLVPTLGCECFRTKKWKTWRS